MWLSCQNCPQVSGKGIASGDDSCFCLPLDPELKKLWLQVLLCFDSLSLVRPLAAWKNSTGRYEISRETVSVDEDAVELKLVKQNLESTFQFDVNCAIQRFFILGWL